MPDFAKSATHNHISNLSRRGIILIVKDGLITHNKPKYLSEYFEFERNNGMKGKADENSRLVRRLNNTHYKSPGNMALTPVTAISIPNDMSSSPMIRVTTLMPVCPK